MKIIIGVFVAFISVACLGFTFFELKKISVIGNSCEERAPIEDVEDEPKPEVSEDDEPEPEVIDDAGEHLSLELSWLVPLYRTDGTILEKEDIKGFNIFSIAESGRHIYDGWYDYRSEYDRVFKIIEKQGTGPHCFVIVTVTNEFDKSEPSEQACYEDHEA